jgi:hypothetical protein
MKRALLALLVLVISSLGVVQAQTPNVPGAAVPVDQTTSTGNNPIIVTRLFTAVRNRVDWFSCVSFKNNSARPVVAIQFKFTYLDAFDTPINTFRGDRVGDFAPGVLIEGPENADIVGGGNVTQKSANCWEVPQMVGSLSQITVEVVKVRYSGGEIWVAPADHSVFSARYMASGGSYVDPPSEIHCGMLNLKWWWFEKYGKTASQKVHNCVYAWEREHGLIAGWEPPDTVAPLPQMSAAPSPMPSASP